MILFIGILLFLILIYYLYISNKKIVNERVIFSPLLNESYYINDKDDKLISDIQLSLNKRDNLYTIKDNKLYKKNKIVCELISI